MAFNLRNRSFLKEIDFEPARAAVPAAAGRARSRWPSTRGTEVRAARRQGDRADLREDLHPHPVGVRGRGLRPGRARHLPGPVRLAAGAQGVDRRHRRSARAACTTRSSSAATARPTSRRSPNTPGCPSTTGSPTSGTPRRCWPTSSPCTKPAASPTTRIGYAFVGDCRFNMGRSLLVMGALDGQRRPPRRARPSSTRPRMSWTSRTKIAERTGARITITEDPAEAVFGVDFIHTDVWVSMGEPKDVWAQRVSLLAPYQVNAALLRQSREPGKSSSCTACLLSTT